MLLKINRLITLFFYSPFFFWFYLRAYSRAEKDKLTFKEKSLITIIFPFLIGVSFWLIIIIVSSLINIDIV
jgi:hypothetical protein